VVCRELLRRNSAVDWGLLLGWLATTGGFLLVAGPEAIRPHWERYGLCLVLPGALLIARAAVILLRPGFAGRAATIGMLAVAWLLLADFRASYFTFVHRTGGESQQTFCTAEVEPKQAAFDLILAAGKTNVPTQIVAGEWWNYWPLAYLATKYPQVSVVREPATSHTPCERWYVDFSGSEEHLQHRRTLVEQQGEAREQSVLDYAGRPILVLLESARDRGTSHDPRDPRTESP